MSLTDHYHLTDSDECWYFGEYTAYKDWSFSETNRLIKNFKKKMSVRGTCQWHHKLKAIAEVGNLFASAIEPQKLQNSLLVPIPPSKVVGDPDYDPRMRKSLDQAASTLNCQLPISECITQIANAEPDHESANSRLYPEDRANTYQIHQDRIPDGTECIILVDDMLTTGSHYKGAEISIKRLYPQMQVQGLFIARRIHENPFELFDISELL
ncbi:MAG: hypothetical protein HWD84_11060 [Flavobacteriaceae bacterium]|nr:hypothetical protein [Flavobacteriaceae bacterium]